MASQMYLLAALCVLPLASAMYISREYNNPFDYDAPDAKVYRRNSFGQIHAYDASIERRFVRNPMGGISSHNVVELSDPDVYTNTIGGVGGMMGYGGNRGGMGQRRAYPTMGFPSPMNTMSNYISGYPSLQHMVM